jgi:phosphatidylglycerophosphatase A
MEPKTNSPRTQTAGKKPRLALAIATVLGVGYIPKAPGTFGSLVGIGIAILADPLCLLLIRPRSGGAAAIPRIAGHFLPLLFFLLPVAALLAIAWIGVRCASRAAAFAGMKDPQYIVIDEVSGQHLTLVLALFPVALPAQLTHNPDFLAYGIYFALSLLNWKYLLAGLILFRVFDIWKPFPIRRLERLPGGWGIMVDDWMAGIYAAIVLRLVLHFGLI